MRILGGDLMSNIDIEGLEFSIADILKDYEDMVYKGTDEGLDVAQKILIKNLKAKSPKLSGEYSRSWKGRRVKKAKLRRVVGNTKTVRGRKRDVPLSNILEYSPTSKHQGLIKRIYQDSIDEMANAVIKEIEKGV